MAERENYFILTGISFDPMETNETIIKETIDGKQQIWTKDLINPLKRSKAQERLSQLEDIKRVLLDPNLRQKEAEQAKAIRKAQYSKLDSQIGILEAKGYIKPNEFESILGKFKDFGISEADIKKRITKPISEKVPEITEQEEDMELIDQLLAAKIENILKQLDGAYSTLYSFLEVRESAAWKQLLEAAEAKRRNLGKGSINITGKLNLELELAGICLTVFKDNASKKKYDNYLSVSKYTELNEAIKQGAINNKKEITPALMEALLDIAVNKYSIRVSEASAYIKRYCKVNGYTIVDGVKTVCGLCKEENPSNAVTCNKCGKPLLIECPSCNTKNGNAAEKCGKCGFDLSKMNLAVDLITNAKKHFTAKKINEALKLIAEAKIYWPNHPDTISLEKDINQQKQQFDSVFSSILEDISMKKFYSAQSKIMQVKSSGFELEQTIVDKVANKIQEIEEKLRKINSISGDEAFFNIVDLAKEVNDCDEVNSLLIKFPPEPATDLMCEVKGSQAILTWKASASAGEVKYIVVRKKNSFSNDERDGDTIYQGTALSFSDGSLLKSQEYYYTVFAIRYDVLSSGCKCDKPVVILPSLENLKAVGGDGIVTLSWKGEKSITEVKIWKSSAEQRPESVQDCESLICNRIDGMNITNLENGKRYWFIVVAFHNINGNIYSSEPVMVSAVPQKPAKPLEDFNVVSNGAIYTSTWAASDWDVILFCSQKKPDIVVGTIYDIDELLKHYQKLDIQMKSLNEADFELNIAGQYYIIPGVINGTNVILNAPYPITNMPEVEQVSFDTNASGSELYINFKWPKKFSKVAIVYRHDTYPEGPEDSLGKYLECTKQQYDYDAAVLLQNPIKGIYYTTIYTVYENDGAKIYSNGVQVMLNNEPQKDVLYSFKYKKGFLSKKNMLTLSVRAEGNFVLPQFVLVSKQGAMPLTRDDGYIIASVMEDTNINTNHSFTFNVEPIQSNTCIKMFFVNDRHYKRYRLMNEGVSKI